MAITREEFSKMIENGETAWGINIYNRVVDVDARNYELIFADDNYIYLYKTKEEAEWVAKTHATREERFEPPTWEEVNKDRHKETFIHKLSKNGKDLWLSIYPFAMEIKLHCGDVRKEYGCKDGYTKENWEKAVTLARKLFLGDEIDG